VAPQQERSTRRLAGFLDAAAELFVEVGYEAATTTAVAELGMLHYSDDIDCGTRHDRQKPENDIHHKRNGKIIEVVLFVFCSLPFHVLPFMPDRFIDGIIAKLKIDRQCVEGFVE
jgi:hypothetical protein